MNSVSEMTRRGKSKNSYWRMRVFMQHFQIQVGGSDHDEIMKDVREMKKTPIGGMKNASATMMKQ